MCDSLVRSPPRAQNVYFATDTENTRMAVRELGNGIWGWASAGAEEGEGKTPIGATPSAIRMSTSTLGQGQRHLVEWVLEELRHALDMEPRGALSSGVK